MNFLQKGLAGLESRLDKVLLDEPDQQQSKYENPTPTPTIIAQTPRPASPAPRRSGEGVGRDGRVTMQERLAAAMAKKNSGTRSGSPAPRLTEATLRGSIDKPRGSMESSVRAKELNGVPNAKIILAQDIESANVKSADPTPLPEPERDDDKEDGKDIPNITTGDEFPTESHRQSIDKLANPPPAASPDLDPVSKENGTNITITNQLSREELEVAISRLEQDLLVCETRRQEESHVASERIDALEEKLRYLARDSATASRSRTTNTPAEKMLAERDEKIALLIEEGEMLSRNELKLQTTIKKLRAKANEEEKGGEEARRKLNKAEKEVRDIEEKLKKLQDSERRFNESYKALSKLEKEVEVLRKDNERAMDTIKELKHKQTELTKLAEDAESRVQTEVLDKEKKKTVDLKAQIERLRSEAAMTEEKLKAEAIDLKIKMGRDMERSKAREVELKAEQSVMESKMEALRARAEEVSSGVTGDAHAKLLRQVETLQTQYAIASENWQGIEGCLMTRIASLERERDDFTKKEGEIRRKAREMNLKSRELELELDSNITRIKDLESDNATQKETVESLRKRALEADTELEELKKSSRREREKLEREHNLRLEEERNKWEESSRMVLTSRPTSPSIAQNMPPSLRKISTALSTTESYFLGYQRQQRPPSRSPSAEPLDTSSPNNRKPSHGGFRTPPIRQDTASTMGYPHLNVSRTSLPAGPEDTEDYFEGITPSSPHQHPDIVSVSTVAAGPSVQLVERMSATVRRLESEMAGSREEITRMATQRDEARQEIIELIEELEEKRTAEKRAQTLEKELAEMNLKMETSLEMLGEKSELVDELRADVADLKQMYRDLVSATIK